MNKILGHPACITTFTGEKNAKPSNFFSPVNIILLVTLWLAISYSLLAHAKYDEKMLYKGAPTTPFIPPSFANSSEVRAADNALIKSCEGFDKVDAQNMFLPTQPRNDLSHLHTRAVEGDVTAQNEIADRYVDGRNLPKDWKIALCWYRAAARYGSAYAEFWLGLFYQQGWIVKQSDPVAAHWFTLARQHHDTTVAERKVADRYADNNSGVHDMSKALVWYERAAKKHDLPAELALGNFYATSHTSSDIQRALSWYGKASAQHSIEADYHIGQIYYRGVGIPQNLPEAHKWLLRAAERGYKPAQYNLAEMYYQGIGVSQDWIKAYAWLEVSQAAENNPAARNLKDRLITHFDPEQLIQAAHLARDYRGRYER